MFSPEVSVAERNWRDTLFQIPSSPDSQGVSRMVGSICRRDSSLYSVELQIVREEIDLVKAISCFSNHSGPEQIDKDVHITLNYHNTVKCQC